MRHRNGRRKSFARRLCREAAPESLGARIGAMPTTADGLHGDAVRSTSHRLSLVGETWNHRDSIRREAAAKAGRRAATAPVRGGVDDRQIARPHVTAQWLPSLLAGSPFGSFYSAARHAAARLAAFPAAGPTGHTTGRRSCRMYATAGCTSALPALSLGVVGFACRSDDLARGVTVRHYPPPCRHQ